MSVLFSGDFHANAVNELTFLTKKALTQKYGEEKYSEIKYHIILGDGGFLWPGNHETDIFNYKSLAARPFPVLCVIGNHEPILGMKNIPETDIGIGEAVYQIESKPFVAYLKRGKVYNIEGHKMLVLGGALSIDKAWRKPGISWWEREYWSEQEKQELFKLLETDNSFDFVISHTGPQRINLKIFKHLMLYSGKFTDEVAELNEKTDHMISCKQWFCGHWHHAFYYFDDQLNRGYQYLYKNTALLRENEIIAPKNENLNSGREN